jgi:hypothetical protein
MQSAIDAAILERVTSILGELTEPARAHDRYLGVRFFDFTAISRIILPSMLDGLFEDHASVAYWDNIEVLEPKHFMSPPAGLSASAERWFSGRSKYTPKRSYYIAGGNIELKEKCFNKLTLDEQICDALIEINVHLGSSNYNYTQMPWGAETVITVSDDCKTTFMRRESRNHPWA